MQASQCSRAMRRLLAEMGKLRRSITELGSHGQELFRKQLQKGACTLRRATEPGRRGHTRLDGAGRSRGNPSRPRRASRTHSGVIPRPPCCLCARRDERRHRAGIIRGIGCSGGGLPQEGALCREGGRGARGVIREGRESSPPGVPGGAGGHQSGETSGGSHWVLSVGRSEFARVRRAEVC